MQLSQKATTSHDIPAFTRTLTVLYSMTLLSLFTHIQLSVLNRSKYVQSVYQHEREDREREALFSDPASIPGKSIPGLATLMSWLSRADDLENIEGSSATGSDTEMKYLTLSWWLLHVGWKDVGERVRRAVEEVFDE
jgi:peroxin-3